MEFKFRASRLSHLDSSTPAVSSRLNTPSRYGILLSINEASYHSISESSILFQSIVTTNPALEQPRLGRPPTQSARLLASNTPATSRHHSAEPSCPAKCSRPKGTGKHQKEAARLAELREWRDHE